MNVFDIAEYLKKFNIVIVIWALFYLVFFFTFSQLTLILVLSSMKNSSWNKTFIQDGGKHAHFGFNISKTWQDMNFSFSNVEHWAFFVAKAHKITLISHAIPLILTRSTLKSASQSSICSQSVFLRGLIPFERLQSLHLLSSSASSF